MNCDKAQDFIMQYFDKTLKPENAKTLIEHMLICTECRELYTMMDISSEVEITHEAPKDFTKNVMKSITSKKEPQTIRLLWGISALIIGLILLINPDIFYSVTTPTSVLDFFTQGISSQVESVGLYALLLVGFMGSLLYVLHNGEKIKT